MLLHGPAVWIQGRLCHLPKPAHPPTKWIEQFNTGHQFTNCVRRACGSKKIQTWAERAIFFSIISSFMLRVAGCLDESWPIMVLCLIGHGQKPITASSEHWNEEMVMQWLVNLQTVSKSFHCYFKPSTMYNYNCKTSQWDCAALPQFYIYIKPLTSLCRRYRLRSSDCPRYVLSPNASTSNPFPFLLTKLIASKAVSVTAMFHAQYEVIALSLADCRALHSHVSHLLLC